MRGAQASVRSSSPNGYASSASSWAAGKTPEYVGSVAALKQALGSLGWKEGENLRIEDRWSAGSDDAARSAAQEVIKSNPDLILGQSATVIEALRSATGTIPIVFLHVADPAVFGFVSNLARPEGNVTGITNIVPSIGAYSGVLPTAMMTASLRIGLGCCARRASGQPAADTVITLMKSRRRIAFPEA